MPDETMGSARKILILSANPRDTVRLRLDKEVREIQDRLKRAKYGNQFTVQLATAVRIRDLQQELLEHEPDIVHFCGHSETEGLLLENNLGEAVLVPSDGLASLFALCSQHVECVLLNSCHSSNQAEVISQHIPYVIGMNREVFDDAAVEFAGGLYAALGAGRNIEESFEFGRNALKLHDLPDELTPILLKKKVVADAPEKPISPRVDNATSSERSPISTSVRESQENKLPACGINNDIPFWQFFRPADFLLVFFHFPFCELYSFLIGLFNQFDDGFDSFPSHRRGPFNSLGD
ncbi:MAG: CHAT domain-containing protein [Candidatus Electrothrix sp. AR1]|nr:CHAT domain-containing protein [Candidatus Electrothrix sp. AR1]